MDATASGEQVRAGRMMLKRTAKSCRSDAPMPASSLREAAQATVSTKHGHRGEHEVSRKTIAQGRPVCFRCTCGDYARVLFCFAREAAGALATRLSLRPLFIEARTVFAKPRADHAAGMRSCGPSFRGDAKHRARNLEIPRCAIAHLRSGANAPSRNDDPLTVVGNLKKLNLRTRERALPLPQGER
jgi:hypothetical protein